jgi:hypothetical protein
MVNHLWYWNFKFSVVTRVIWNGKWHLIWRWKGR